MTEDRLNDEKIKKAMEKLQERINPSEEQMKRLKEFAEKYKNKTEEDIFFEIIKLNNIMSESMSEEEYNRKMQKLERIRPMLNPQQLKKLDKLMEAFKKNKK